MTGLPHLPSERRLVRRYTRYPVRWLMLYGNDHFTAAGTILDVTQAGWKLMGQKPVVPGMRLQIRAFPPGRERPLLLKDATVRWANGGVFAIDVRDAPSKDVAWLSEYLDEVFSLWLFTPRPRPRRGVHTPYFEPSMDLVPPLRAKSTSV